MSIKADPWAFTTLHVNAQNREVASRWYWRGSLPCVAIFGAFLCLFDGNTLWIRTRYTNVAHRIA